MAVADDLFAPAERLSQQARYEDDPDVKEPLAALTRAANEVGRAWSGSWLGYQSRIYYEDFAVPPAGAHFSREWGFISTFSSHTVGQWREYRYEDVVARIEQIAGSPSVAQAQAKSKGAAEVFDDVKPAILSILSIAVGERPNDTFLSDLLGKVKGLRVFTESEVLQHAAPSGQFMSRDMSAIEGGIQTPPHLAVLARVTAFRQPFQACREMAKVAQQAASHLKNQESRARIDGRIGTNVFIGHGRSAAWKDLRDFVRDRVHLPWDEFNRVPVAGVANVARLSQMLDAAAIAFLVMTAEDEQVDGKLHARMNVVHEAGLFQGRLGFERAIVLLEDGCEEFSNIQGLGQIRFPRGNISAVFESIRQVLEREGLTG